jgi:hypothetical protein
MSTTKRSLKTKMVVGGFVLAAGLMCLSAASTITACASVPDDKRFTAMINPNYPVFRDSVDPYIEKQCGTLDCHGEPGRGFRVYGFRGLRLYSQEAGLVPGVQQTTAEEINANFFALISVEPETFNRVMAKNGQDADSLLFMRKAMNLERHKGGALFAKDSAPYRCITAWLRLVPDPNATLGTTDQAFCDKAKTQP